MFADEPDARVMAADARRGNTAVSAARENEMSEGQATRTAGVIFGKSEMTDGQGGSEYVSLLERSPTIDPPQRSLFFGAMNVNEYGYGSPFCIRQLTHGNICHDVCFFLRDQ